MNLQLKYFILVKLKKMHENHMKRIKYLMFGPYMPPVHGQSLAFSRFCDIISKEEKIIIDTNYDDKAKYEKIITTIWIIINIILVNIIYKYNVVYFTCSRSVFGSIKDILLITIANIRNVKIINHLHGSDFYEFIHKAPRWYKKIIIWTYEKVDISIVPLEKMKVQFKDFDNMSIKVVPNFYDKELDISYEQKSKKEINIIYLSNIIKSKGIIELIEAFKILIKKYNIKLLIAGDFVADNHMSISEIKNVFYEKIKNNENIKYYGSITGIDKVKLLQKSDIFTLPSYYKSEAFPISIIEAMACQNAIVTTDYMYLSEIVKSKNGVLVKVKSIESLIEGIEKLLKDEAMLKKIQKNNMNEARQKYSIDVYLKKLNEIVDYN